MGTGYLGKHGRSLSASTAAGSKQPSPTATWTATGGAREMPFSPPPPPQRLRGGGGGGGGIDTQGVHRRQTVRLGGGGHAEVSPRYAPDGGGAPPASTAGVAASGLSVYRYTNQIDLTGSDPSSPSRGEGTGGTGAGGGAQASFASLTMCSALRTSCPRWRPKPPSLPNASSSCERSSVDCGVTEAADALSRQHHRHRQHHEQQPRHHHHHHRQPPQLFCRRRPAPHPVPSTAAVVLKPPTTRARPSVGIGSSGGATRWLPMIRGSVRWLRLLA